MEPILSHLLPTIPPYLIISPVSVLSLPVHFLFYVYDVILALIGVCSRNRLSKSCDGPPASFHTQLFGRFMTDGNADFVAAYLLQEHVSGGINKDDVCALSNSCHSSALLMPQQI